MTDLGLKQKPTRLNQRWLSAIDRLLIAGIKLGPAGKKDAINKVLQLVPQWTRGDCWRRLRHLRTTPALNLPEQPKRCTQPDGKQHSSKRRVSRPWTSADDDRLLNWAGYEPVSKIAHRLRRSEHAIRSRMGALGMSAKVSDGWSLRSLRKLLRVSPHRLRLLIGSGLLRARDPRVTAASLASFVQIHLSSLGPAVTERFTDTRQHNHEGYSTDRAAEILGVSMERIQALICHGQLKIVDPFVTDRHFEEFCSKHSEELNLALMDAATVQWLVKEYGIHPPGDTKGLALARVQKHVLTIRTCQCGREIAGNAYFRHAKACPSTRLSTTRSRPPSGAAPEAQLLAS
jgi:hypothetical protein